jgi:serine kinase of HPr protein (carbohydrate metabolism regulator)
MKVYELRDKLNLNVLGGREGLDRDVSGAYCCDLLSWVMSHGKKGDAWITVQTHPNIVAVASLLELSCIIIPEEIEVEKITLEKADQERITILQSKENSYSICCYLKEAGI